MADGIVIIDKPQGWTSMDVCAKLRGILRTRKVGHAGTLDPMATGVLPVFVGRATRGVTFAESGDKEYVATLRLGLVTDTQDVTGTVLPDNSLEVHYSVEGAEKAVAFINPHTEPITVHADGTMVWCGGEVRTAVSGEIEIPPRTVVIVEK